MFSDNGKGISLISFPAINLAYMAADRGAITMYFNHSAPFEENSLTVVGESFEKTSVTVTCDVGKEADLMESIIDFINRNTATNVMRFDSIGGLNTFKKLAPSPTIDARVRARPVERGLVGTEAIVTGLDPNSVVNSIDFLKVANVPFIDLAGENITGSTGSPAGCSNSGSSGTDYTPEFSGRTSTGALAHGPIVKEPDGACSEKTFSFDFSGCLKTDTDLSNAGAALNVTHNSQLDPNLTSEASNGVLVSRGGSVFTPPIAPAFIVSTDAIGEITAFEATKCGLGIEPGDILLCTFETNGGVTYVVPSSDFSTKFNFSSIGLVVSPPVPDIPFPIEDYVTYMTLVIPNGALTQPVYSTINASDNFQTFASGMGPFPFDSLGNEFEINHGIPPEYTTGTQSTVFNAINNSFPYLRVEGSALTSEDNLFSFVIRRTISGDLYVYSRDGELEGFRESTELDRDTKLDIRSVGLPLPFNTRSPQIRLARFGVIRKDAGDLFCRNLATQLYDHYKHKHV